MHNQKPRVQQVVVFQKKFQREELAYRKGILRFGLPLIQNNFSLRFGLPLIQTSLHEKLLTSHFLSSLKSQDAQSILQNISEFEKAVHYVYLTHGIHVQMHNVAGDGNCLYHCLFHFYTKYNLKTLENDERFTTTVQLKKFLIT